MVIRATNQNTPKQISAVDAEVKKSHPLVKSLIAEFRKENARLQNLIAKNQVAYESEINKIHAQAENKTRATLNINFSTPKPKSRKVKP